MQTSLAATEDARFATRSQSCSPFAAIHTGGDACDPSGTIPNARRIHRILDEIPGGMLIVDARGRVEYCSAGFVRITGMPVAPRDLAGKTWAQACESLMPMLAPETAQRIRSQIERGAIKEDAIHMADGRVLQSQYTQLLDPCNTAAGGAWMIQDVTAQKQHETRIRALAERDSLTSLANRGAFERMLDEAVASNMGGMTLGIIDLDDFKSVNDRFGHAAGDALLAEVASRLRLALGGNGTAEQFGCGMLARLGGDEFAVLLRGGDDARYLQQIAERIMSVTADFFEVDGKEISVRLSLGLAVRDSGASAQSLLRHADIALYSAKAAGRNRACVFEQSMLVEIESYQGWVSEVEDALREDRLELLMQPILSVRAGAETVSATVPRVEALLRLRGRDGRLHSAGQFERVLNESRLAAPIGRWILSCALNWSVQWRALGHDVSIGVNISQRHFLSPGFVEDIVQALLANPQASAANLTLELTEHGAFLDSSATRNRIEDCRSLGVNVSLDDFGTGNANLIHLQDIPVSTLKVDRCFTKNLLTDSRGLSITYGILLTAKLMGMNIIAEGVESPEIAKVLVAMGCHELQGHAIARPMPARAIPAWLRTWSTDLDWINDLRPSSVLDLGGIEALVRLDATLRRLAQDALDNDNRRELAAMDAAHAQSTDSFGIWLAQQAVPLKGHPLFEALRQAYADLCEQICRAASAQPRRASGLDIALADATRRLRESFWGLALSKAA